LQVLVSAIDITLWIYKEAKC